MLRRAPTSISLSNRDVAEHFEHFEQKKLQGRSKSGLKKDNGILSEQAACKLTDILPGQLDENIGNKVTVYEYRGADQPQALQGNTSPFVPQQQHIVHMSLDDTPPDYLNRTVPTIDPCSDSEIDETSDLVHPFDSSRIIQEPLVVEREHSLQHPSQSPRATSGYGGVVEVVADSSTPFLPHEVSTPGNNELPGVRSLRLRFPLPRSPLSRAQVAYSPGKSLTTGMAPRMTSYGTSGLLLSQPPRRPRNYRPRSLSYSFEESERASAAQEQSEGSDSDSIPSQIDSDPQKNMREEINAGSAQNSSIEKNLPSSRPEATDVSSHKPAQEVTTVDKIQREHSPSPHFPLPPPFSAVHRNVSSAASLPSVHGDVTQPKIPTPSYDIAQLQASPVAGPAASSGEEEEDSGNTSGGVFRGLAALPLRLLSAYRSRSPFQTRFDGSDSGRESLSTPRSPSHGPEDIPATNTRNYHFQIYDDSIPASTQPQTPQHLPEARHQSRFHPSYTAPASGRMESPRGNRSELSRRRGTRSDSPTGLETPGFQGLYGGRENTDDDVMFDRSSQQLWRLSSAWGHGRRSVSNTPDRGSSFADTREDIR